MAISPVKNPVFDILILISVPFQQYNYLANPRESKVCGIQVRTSSVSLARISESKLQEILERSYLFLKLYYFGWKLTAALQPGKLKKVSGPCLCGIWLRTDNNLTACLGCENKKIALK